MAEAARVRVSEHKHSVLMHRLRSTRNLRVFEVYCGGGVKIVARPFSSISRFESEQLARELLRIFQLIDRSFLIPDTKEILVMYRGVRSVLDTVGVQWNDPNWQALGCQQLAFVNRELLRVLCQ